MQATTGSTSPPGSPPATGSPTGTTASTEAAGTTTAPPSRDATFTDADAIRAVQAYADGLSRSFQTGDPKYLAAVTDDLCPCRYAPQKVLEGLRHDHQHTTARLLVEAAMVTKRSAVAVVVRATFRNGAYEILDSANHVVDHGIAAEKTNDYDLQMKQGKLSLIRVEQA